MTCSGGFIIYSILYHTVCLQVSLVICSIWTGPIVGIVVQTAGASEIHSQVYLTADAESRTFRILFEERTGCMNFEGVFTKIG